MLPVRVIAGLGNPGQAYDGTRHNIGFSVLDQFARRHGGSWKSESRYRAQTAGVVLHSSSVLLVKPQTFMNLSGASLQEICRYFRWHPSQIVVVYDEYTLPVGKCKVSLKGSAAGHNGIGDILARLGDSFIRYRIGIGPEEKPQASLTDFVLGKFTESEQSTLSANMERLLDGLELLVHQGAERAMNAINQRKTNL